MRGDSPLRRVVAGRSPAEPAYAALLTVLGERIDAVAKDLEVYAGEGCAIDARFRYFSRL